jgi:putative cardiolipin synthase
MGLFTPGFMAAEAACQASPGVARPAVAGSLGALRRCAAVLSVLACALAGLSGCASPLPPLPDREPQAFLVAGPDSPLSRAMQPRPADAGAGASGLVLLRDPAQALATRVLLARQAQRALDIQVYIWRPDASGRVLMHEVWRAAERGVRVRLLLDDNGSDGLDDWLQTLDAHPGIEVRLYNPFGQRRFKALGYLTDFVRLNRRMHNKSFTADGLATIVGGRNVADVYYGVDARTLFADMDALAMGPAAQDTARNFDAFWNSARAHPLAGLLEPSEAAVRDRQRQELADPSTAPEVAALLASLQATPWLSAPALAGYPALQWAGVQVLSDAPDKPARGSSAAAPGGRITEPILQGIAGTRATLDLVSPYFVPGDAGVQGLVDLARRGVKVRIVTNSLAATDVMAVHAGYARHRRTLLAAGIELHELKAHASSPVGEAAPAWRTRLGFSSTASLHGKVFLADGQRLFIGSFNLDPRSANLNTEMGLVIDSPALSRELAAQVERDLPKGAYRLSLTASGELQWEERGPAGRVVHAREPGAGLLRRVGAQVLSWLPIEGLL